MVRDIVFTLFGRVLPVALTLAVIPLVIRGMGSEKYGLLNLVLLVIGYLGLFDLGIGRATTRFVAEFRTGGHAARLPGLVWTAWVMLAGLGLAAAGLLAALTPLLVRQVLQVPPELAAEATVSLYLMGGAIPFMLLTAGARGVLEGLGEFRAATAVQIPFSLLDIVIPLAVLAFTDHLAVMVAALLVSRVVCAAVHLAVCLYWALPPLRRRPGMQGGEARRLLGFGGWLTVSNLISPFMEYLDRFILGAVAGLTAVTHYAVPYAMVTKLFLISGSAMTVLFPVFARGGGDRAALAPLYGRAVKSVFLVIAPLAAVIALLARPIMTFWIDEAFAAASSPVLLLLAPGVLVNAVALVPYSLLQALDRPDLPARLHAAEVLPYLALSVFLIARYGAAGAAAAWTVRVTVDAALLFWLARRVLFRSHP